MPQKKSIDFPNEEDSPQSHLDKLLTPGQAADKLGVKKATLASWRWLDRYSLRYIRVGRRIMYLKKDIDDFINERASR